MGFVINMSNMSLIDLLELRNQTFLGHVEVDQESSMLLSNYIQMRIDIVTKLEDSFAHDDYRR